MGNRFTRFAVVLALVIPLALASDKGTLTTMTQNMDAGTDLNILFYYAAQGKLDLGVAGTYQQVLASNVPARASILAGEIAARQPDIVSLQEVTSWQVISAAPQPDQPSFDQLALLMDELKARRQNYTVVIQNELTDVTLPMTVTTALRLLDRDVVIARDGLTTSNTQKGLYQTLLSFTLAPGLEITAERGWITTDVTVGEQTVRFAATHLESTFPALPQLTAFQVAQGMELCALLTTSPYPVIIAGDFNSNAEPTPFEQTPTVGYILSQGYTDVWDNQHPGAPGFTWPLYLEDPIAPSPSGPYERIDLIFAKGLSKPVWVKPVTSDPPFASDHRGVAAKFSLE